MVYPRVCGVDKPVIRVGVPVEGLSPRVRGRSFSRRGHDEQLRFIPACAG